MTIPSWPDRGSGLWTKFSSSAGEVARILSGTYHYSYFVIICFIANFERETGLNPNAIGDRDSAFGLAQRHQARIDAVRVALGFDIRLLVLAKKNTLALDLQATDWELRTFGYYGWDKINSCLTVEDSASQGCALFEKAGLREAEAQSALMATRWSQSYPSIESLVALG